jgi:hypothetical protein
MTFQTVTIWLPDSIYRQMAQRARRKQRTIEDEVAEVVTSAIPIAKALPSEKITMPACSGIPGIGQDHLYHTDLVWPIPGM